MPTIAKGISTSRSAGSAGPSGEAAEAGGWRVEREKPHMLLAVAATIVVNYGDRVTLDWGRVEGLSFHMTKRCYAYLAKVPLPVA